MSIIDEKTVEVTVLDAFPSPCGDKYNHKNTINKALYVMFPSPCGDEYNPVTILMNVWAFRSFRPLAGMSIIAEAAKTLNREIGFRPLAGMSIISEYFTFTLFASVSVPLRG